MAAGGSSPRGGSSEDKPRTELQEAVKRGRREQLEALRDYIANQLEANMCKSCLTSRLRTGDQAALILRLQQILAELEALPGEGTVDDLDSLRQQITDGAPGRTSDSADISLARPGAQHRPSSHRPSGPGGAVSR